MLTLMQKLSGRALPEFRRHLFSALMESLLVALPYGLILIVLAQLLRTTPDQTILTLCCAVLIVIFGMRWWVTGYHHRTTSVFGYQAGRDIRLRLARHLRVLPMGTLEKREAGELHAIAIQDTEYAEQIFSHLYAQILITFCLSTLMLTGLALKNLPLALALGAPLPLALWVGWKLSEMGRQQGKTLLCAIAQVNAGLLEYLHNLPLLRAYNQAGPRFSRLDARMRDHAEHAIRMEWMGGLAPVAFIMVLQLGLPLLLLTGQQQLLDNQLTLLTFLLFLVIAPRFVRPLTQLAVFGAELNFMALAAGRIEGLLDEPTLPAATNNDQSHFDAHQPINFNQVSFAYQTRPVLEDISLSIQPRTVTALVGPSGSGKTSLIRLLARFWDANEGDIEIGGQPMTSWTQDALLAHISIVFQDVYLFQDSVLNNLRAGKEISETTVIAACKAANCHDFIMALPEGYNTQIGEGGGTLSGGEKQRLSIARAILKDAPIVLLDEATASLDPENERQIQQALSQLCADKTVIMIAHKLRTVQHADQILVLDKGRILERGQHQSLLAQQGLYAELWQRQQVAQGWRM